MTRTLSRKLLAVFAVAAGISSLGFSEPPAEEISSGSLLPDTVRIGILERVPSFNIGCEDEYQVQDLNSDKNSVFSPQDILLVEAGDRGIRMGGSDFSDSVRIVPRQPNCPLRVNGRRYRDILYVQANPRGGLTVINEVELDHYIYGILPYEVSPDWPLESLKAQAVVSRTFALKNMNRHKSQGFNLCSRVHCQVYGGMEGEKDPANRAVDETSGEVILFHGELANTVFFSNCGGKTEDPKNAWDSFLSLPYLRVQACRFCRAGRHYRWAATLRGAEIAEALNKYGVRAPIASIKILSHGKSGRVKYLKIKHAKGDLKIRASHFRLALGPDSIRSTFFSEIRKVKIGFFFKGKGWGHGVGFCQEGAKGMADQGKNYKKIIHFYYPGVKIKKWE